MANIKVERWGKANRSWVRVAEYPADQKETAEAYAQDRQHVTGRRYRVS